METIRKLPPASCNAPRPYKSTRICACLRKRATGGRLQVEVAERPRKVQVAVDTMARPGLSKEHRRSDMRQRSPNWGNIAFFPHDAVLLMSMVPFMGMLKLSV